MGQWSTSVLKVSEILHGDTVVCARRIVSTPHQKISELSSSDEVRYTHQLQAIIEISSVATTQSQPQNNSSWFARVFVDKVPKFDLAQELDRQGCCREPTSHQTYSNFGMLAQAIRVHTVYVVDPNPNYHA